MPPARSQSPGAASPGQDARYRKMRTLDEDDRESMDGSGFGA
jgi:hypothetical protein